MNHWYEIADTSYQTTDELDIINSTAANVVADIPATGAKHQKIRQHINPNPTI
jgi:hypothetical protein